MKVYITGKVKGYTKETLKEYVKRFGHEFKSLSKTTELLIIAEKPGQGRINSAREWGIKTMSWEEFEETHLK